MNRRKFITATLGLSLAALVKAEQNNYSHPDDEKAVRQYKPAKLIGNYKEDRYRIYMFISFACPFCAQTWRDFGTWGLSLPKPYKFVYVPIFNNRRQNLAGAAFYVVRLLAHERLPEFLNKAFTLQQKPGLNDNDYIGILYNMGFTREQIANATENELTRKRIARAMLLFERYKVAEINRTPVFGVAGKYLTHTGYTPTGSYREVADNLNWLLTDEIEKNT